MGGGGETYHRARPPKPVLDRGQKNRPRNKKTNSWERRFPGTFRTNVPLILPIFSVFSVGGGPKVPRNFVPGNFFFLILGGFSPCDWRPQKVKFACSAPVSSKENNRAKTNGGETYHRWGGSKTVLGKGVLWYVFPSPEFSIPPLFFSDPTGHFGDALIVYQLGSSQR